MSCIACGPQDVPPDPPHQPASDRSGAESQSVGGFVMPSANIADLADRVGEAKAAIAEFDHPSRPRDDSHQPRPEHRQHQAPDPGGMEEQIIPARQYAILVQGQAGVADTDDGERIGQGISRRDSQPPKPDADRGSKLDQVACPIVERSFELRHEFLGGEIEEHMESCRPSLIGSQTGLKCTCDK